MRCAYFEQVLAAANLRFSRMSGDRFELRRKVKIEDQRSRSGLEIIVYDAHIDCERGAQTLSGGEGFLAALALALGTSDVVQAEAGGSSLTPFPSTRGSVISTIKVSTARSTP